MFWRLALACFCFLTIVPIASAQDTAWRSDTPLPYTPAFHQSVAVAGRLTVIGGEIGSGPVADSFSTPLTAAARWQPSESLPQPLAHAALAVDGTRVFLLGGWNGRGVQRTVLQASIAADGTVRGWTALPDLLPEPRRGARAAIRAGVIYLLGGEDDTGRPVGTVFAATVGPAGIGGPWRSFGPLSEPVEDAAAVVAGDALLVLGGRGVAATAATWSFGEPSWAQQPPLPAPRAQAAAAANGDRVILAGGFGATYLDSVITARVQPGLSTWSPLPPLPIALTGASLAIWDGTAFLSGGYDGSRYLNGTYRLAFGPRLTPAAPAAVPEPPIDFWLLEPETTPFIPIVGVVAIVSLAVAVTLMVRERLSGPGSD